MSARPKKRLGQHFLHDPAVIARIIETIEPKSGDRMVEIGPGEGALTEPLIALLDKLHVIELDSRLAARLKAGATGSGLIVHQDNALKFDYATLASRPQSLRVVGNLPYNISTPLIFALLKQRSLVVDMHLMLQREVVQRMVAPPGGKTYGRLTVMLALAARVERCFDIGPGAFRPPPKVWSSFIRVIPYPHPPFAVENERLLAQLVAQAFSMRRKRISNSLKPWLVHSEIAELGIDPALRPERITAEQFVGLANLAAKKAARAPLK